MKMSDEMFEGEDYPTQWALNPAAYQNMNSDQVDWAALAQQWIKMKETSVPPAPPPPSIANEFQCLSSNNGGGEAPMDMDTKDDDIPPAPPAPNISGTDGWNQWSQWGGSQWNQNTATPGNWEWNNSIPPGLDGKSVGISNVPSNVIIPPPAPTISASPPFPNHCGQSNAVQTAVPPIPPSFGYSTMPLPPSQFSNQVSPNSFWNSEHSHPAVPVTTVPIQTSPFIKGLRQNSNRIPLVPTSASTLTTAEMVTPRNREVRDRTPEDDFSSTLDTVKRRQLPAWIREGLEKMEREKQKAVERERQEILRKQELEARKKIEDQARAVLNPSRSKFDSDSEKETTEHEYDDDNKVSSNSNEDKQSPKDISEQHSPDLMRPRKTRFRDADSPVVQTRAAVTTHKEKSPDNTSVLVASSLRQNKEEMLQNLMLKVRRSLTEILLEVTNDEISSVCKEVWKRYCSKGQSLISSSHTAAPVSQITRKLGLGIYGDSNSESDEEYVSNHEHSQQSPGDNDSEEELKETLRRRQQAFRKTEAEIEARLAEEEEEEEDEDEDRVKVKRSGEQDEADNLRKKAEGSLRDDRSSREKDVRNEGSGRGTERRLKKDSGMGNTSGSKIVDTEVNTIYGNERKSSEVQSSISKGSTSKSTAADNARLAEGNDSSSSESADHYNSSKRTARSSKSKSSKSSSRKKVSRYGENKDGSSSRSRSRSRNEYSSREGSRASSRSSEKPETVSNIINRTSGDGIDGGNASSNRNRASNRRVKNHMRKSSEKQYVKSKSRSSSQSDNNRSRSRSRSHSRSTSRSRSNRTKRSRSRSGSRRRRRSRARHRSRSHSPTRTRTRTRSRSRSHYRSRSRRRSRSYSHKSRGTSKKRDTRSRSPDRSRRSRSNTRSSKSHYYRHRHHYRQDRDGKKSTHRYED